MVFHTPYPLNRQATSASGIRPVRMRDAFASLGYEVWEVTGTAKDRSAAARKVRHAIKAGITFDFCYSESSTMPTTMTEPHHLPSHPLLDFRFLADLRRAHVRVGLFYRDVYWAFPGYGADLTALKRQAALAGYRYDLAAYERCLDVLYLPSAGMAPHVGLKRVPMRALPPGHDMPEPGEAPTRGAHLFYVGGMGDNYRLPVLAEAVSRLAAGGSEVSLTICTRPREWQDHRAEYEPFVGDAVRIVHGSGAQLDDFYAAANIASLFVEPNEYWGFASPVKLYEYVGRARPILASEGTLGGQFVADNRFGWTIPYSVEAAMGTLGRLASNPSEVAEVRAHLLAHREEHSWLGRAQQVAQELGHA